MAGETNCNDCGRLLAFAEIRFVIRFSGSGTLPRFRGATLRGAIGFALRQAVCHIQNTACPECPVVGVCAYSCLFEGVAPAGREILRKYPNIPQPFVIIVNGDDPTDIQAGQEYSFAIRLFGQNINHVPYLAYALMQAGQKGLGRDRIPFEVVRIVQAGHLGQERTLYDGSSSNIQPAVPDATAAEGDQDEAIAGRLKIAFETPVRFRENGNSCSQADFMPFFKAVLRRVRLMTYFYGIDISEHCDMSGLLDKGQGISLFDDCTQHTGFSRYSNRQKRRTPLEGITGSAIYEGEFGPILPILKLAVLTHVGKATSFGFGRIALEMMN